MPMSWTMRDALGQFSVLVARKAQLEIPGANVRLSSRSADLTPLSPPSLGNPESMQSSDVRTALRLLQQFMCSVISGEEVAEAGQHLLTLAKQYEGLDHNTDQTVAAAAAAGNKVAPSTSDKKETIDDKKDASITFLLLDTLCQLLSSVLKLESAASAHAKRTDLFRLDQRMTVVTPPATHASSSAAGPIITSAVHTSAISGCGNLVPFAFGYLTHTYTSAVRHAACRLLGILSIQFLPNITSLLGERFSAAKKDQAKREFASLQRCVSFLDFRVGNPTQVKVTLSYLTQLLSEMKNVDRGVLRKEICSSLDSLFVKLLAPNPADPLREEEWQRFVKGDKGVEDFYVLYERIFAMVAKWSQKSKHQIFCYELLAHMAVLCRQFSFFQSKKRFDIATELIKTISKEKGEVRKDAMRILARNYLRHLPSTFQAAEPTDFQNQLRQLLPALLPKKTKPIPDEIPIMTELLVSAGRRNLTSFVDDFAIEVLRPGSPYYSRQKAIVLQALSSIALESPEKTKEMAKFYLHLGPLVSPYIEEAVSNPHLRDAEALAAAKKDGEEEDKELLLLRAALRCWPAIRHSKLEHVQVTAAAVILLAKHDDRETSGYVSACLQNFIQLDLGQFALPTLHAALDLLKLDRGIDKRPDQMLKICNTISLLGNTLAEHLAKLEAEQRAEEEAAQRGEMYQPKEQLQQFQVTSTAWLALREHMEAVVLMRLCHFEGWVRVELLRMLATFARPCFRQLEQAVSMRASVVSPGAGSPTKAETSVPYLIDYLLPGAAKGVASGATPIILPTNESFYRPLHDLLTQHFDRFQGLLSYAFSFMHKDLESIHTMLDQNASYPADLLQEEWWCLFRNKMLFCCLAVRSTQQVGESVEGVTAPAASTTSGSSQSNGHSLLSAQDLALKFTNSRPRLRHYECKLHEVYTFYENLVSFLQFCPASTSNQTAAQQMAYNSNPATSGLYQVKLAMAKDLSMVSPSPLSNYADLARHLRKPLSDHEAWQAAAANNPKSKKKGPDVKKSFYMHEMTLHVFASLFSRVAPGDYLADQSVLSKCLDDYLQFWLPLAELNQYDMLKQLTVRGRLHLATLFARFLAFCAASDGPASPAHSPVSKFSVSRSRPFFFQLLTHLTASPAESKEAEAGTIGKDAADSVRALETAVLQGVCNLLQLGPMQDESLEQQILRWLEQLLFHHHPSTPLPPHLHAGISQALNTFLQLNPGYVHEFVRMSVSESHGHKGGAPPAPSTDAHGRRGSVTLSADERHLIHREAHPQLRPMSITVARYYLRALATNWTHHLRYWKQERGVSLAAMLLIALLAQCSSDPEARAIGLLLAAELEQNHELEIGGANGAISPARRRSGSHDKTFNTLIPIRLYSHESPFMYLESTFSYSRSLAAQGSYLSYILPMLAQSVILFGYISTSRKECLLRLLLPWVYEVGSLLSMKEEWHAVSGDHMGLASMKECVAEVMAHLTDLTRMSYPATLLTQPMQQLWVALLSNDNLKEHTVRLFSSELLHSYGSLIELADSLKKHPSVATGSLPPRPSPLTTPSHRPNVARQPSHGVPHASSPTNLDTLTSGVTNVDGLEGSPLPVKPNMDAVVAANQGATEPAALVGVQPVSLAVEATTTAADAQPCPSPVQDGGEQIPQQQAAQSPQGVDPASIPLPSPSSVSGMHASEVGLSSPAAASSTADPFPRSMSASPSSHASPLSAPLSARDVSKEKALRKLIAVNLIRSPAGQEIIGHLMSQLRDYQQACPLDPDAFMEWTENRIAGGGTGAESLGEPLTIQERGAFELMSNAVFENRYAVQSGHNGGPPNSSIPEAAGPDDCLTPYYPLLLHNAYTLFNSSAEGHEMLTHLALALGLYDYRAATRGPTGEMHAASRSSPITSEQLIPLLVRAYPELRHRWSTLALTWACNSLDVSVCELSFHLWMRLEESSFFFGEKNQEQLLRALLMLFHTLRRHEHSNLKSIVRTLVSPTAFPYDKLGWTALISSGWALLSLSDIPTFSLGLSMVQGMLRLTDVSRESQRNWILSLGRFLCKSSDQEVDTAIVDVLYKGLVSTKTVQPTLMLLQSLADIYAIYTLPPSNRVLVLLLLANVMQRCRDIDALAETWRSQRGQAGESTPDAPTSPNSHYHFTTNSGPPSVDQAGAQANYISMDEELEKRMLRAVDDCVNQALLLHAYSTSEAEGAKKLGKMALLFKNMALSLSRLLPDAQLDVSSSEEDGESSDSPSAASTTSTVRDPAAALANFNRMLLFKKMKSLVKTTEEKKEGGEQEEEKEEEEEVVDNPFSNQLSPHAQAEQLDGVRVPTSTAFASQFFLCFTPFFSSATNFDFTLDYFVKLLQHAPREWHSTLMLMLGHFLLEATRFPDAKQVQLLAELMTQMYFQHAGSSAEAKLAQQIIHLLIEKRPNGDNLDKFTDMFSFVRSRASKKAPAQPASNQLPAVGAEKSTPLMELNEALNRLEAHTFPILRTMATQTRELRRPMDEQAALQARQQHARQASRDVLAQPHHGHAHAESAPGPHSHRPPHLQKRLSFATLNEFQAAHLAAGAGVEVDPNVPAAPMLATPARQPARQAEQEVEQEVVEEKEEEEQAQPAEEVPQAPDMNSSPSRKLPPPLPLTVNSSDPEQGEEEEEVIVPPSLPVPPVAPPAPTPSAAAIAAVLRPSGGAVSDSDSDDDAALFAAATRRLSESQKQAKKVEEENNRLSESESSEIRGGRETEDEQ